MYSLAAAGQGIRTISLEPVFENYKRISLSASLNEYKRNPFRGWGEVPRAEGTAKTASATTETASATTEKSSFETQSASERQFYPGRTLRFSDFMEIFPVGASYFPGPEDAGSDRKIADKSSDRWEVVPLRNQIGYNSGTHHFGRDSDDFDDSQYGRNVTHTESDSDLKDAVRSDVVCGVEKAALHTVDDVVLRHVKDFRYAEEYEERFYNSIKHRSGNYDSDSAARNETETDSDRGEENGTEERRKAATRPITRDVSHLELVLKIDVEGYDCHALAGAEEALWSYGRISFVFEYSEITDQVGRCGRGSGLRKYLLERVFREGKGNQKPQMQESTREEGNQPSTIQKSQIHEKSIIQQPNSLHEDSIIQQHQSLFQSRNLIATIFDDSFHGIYDTAGSMTEVFEIIDTINAGRLAGFGAEKLTFNVAVWSKQGNCARQFWRMRKKR
jgi:hypothetical protein